MADLLLEQHYYDALLTGLQRGYRLSGQEMVGVPDDVDAALQKAARRQATQLEKMVVDAPEDREKVATLLDEWLQGDELSLADLDESLIPIFGAARALTIARTETGWSMNMGNSAALRGNGWNKVTWVAAFDACETCQALNGTTMTIDEYEEQALQHPNCACTAVPAEDDEGDDADVAAAREETDLDPAETGEGDFNRAPPDVPADDELADVTMRGTPPDVE